MIIHARFSILWPYYGTIYDLHLVLQYYDVLFMILIYW